MKIITLLIALTAIGHAAVFTSTTNGNWSSNATWGGGGHPGNGDTAIVGHLVTVDVNTIVGASNGKWASGGNPAAIQTNTLGAVTIAASVSLTIRGDFAVNN